MRIIDRAATFQMQLPTLELREKEIMNMYQSKPGRSCRFRVSRIRKPYIPQCSRQELGDIDGNSHRHFSSSTSPQS